jgi:regulator of nonsense transcripts 2
MAAAVTEAKLKMSDIPCAVLICSLMYQRYTDFQAALMENWQKYLHGISDIFSFASVTAAA